MDGNMVSEYAEAAAGYVRQKNFDFAVNKIGLGIICFASLAGRDTGNAKADAILKQIRELAADLNMVNFNGEDLLGLLDEK